MNYPVVETDSIGSLSLWLIWANTQNGVSGNEGLQKQGVRQGSGQKLDDGFFN